MSDGHSRTTVTMPQSEDYSWGLIRLVDRLGVSNEYLTFGGHLDAALIDDVVVAAFASQAPLLRRGGHSQGWDAGADAIGAFFARLMVAVDFKPGFEQASRPRRPSPVTRRSCATPTDDAVPRDDSASLDDDLGRLAATRGRPTASICPDASGTPPCAFLDTAVLD